ncbi:MAG: hypothetical protein KKF22_15585 [Gammaproteobacteria bacterium]|nr:hypothetical protein [Gammaproteobacteria bacterium]
MMTQPFLNQASTVQYSQLLEALNRLFVQAKNFYQRRAETAGPGNLRRQFAALAELHQHILYLLPPSSSATHDIEALSELSYWYSQKSEQVSLHRIQRQLAKQLQLQKAIIRSCDLRQHKSSLLHFTASVQIAADQLAEST